MIRINGEEMTWEEYERREEERKNAYFAEQAKHYKTVSELEKGDKIKFECGDFNVYITLRVESVNEFEVTGEVLASDRIDYEPNKIATINFGYDKQFRLVD